MNRILICGSRTWENPRPIELVVDRLIAEASLGHARSGGAAQLLVITGGAAGVDTIAETVCKARGIHVARVDALWDTYHRSAGPRRNAVMLSLQPERVIAFHFSKERLGEDGSGTGRCIQQARKLGIAVSVKLAPLEVAMPSSAWEKERKAAKAAGKRPRKRG